MKEWIDLLGCVTCQQLDCWACVDVVYFVLCVCVCVYACVVCAGWVGIVLYLPVFIFNKPVCVCVWGGLSVSYGRRKD